MLDNFEPQEKKAIIIFIALLSMILGESLAPITDLSAENRRNAMLNKAGDGFARFGAWKREPRDRLHQWQRLRGCQIFGILLQS